MAAYVDRSGHDCIYPLISGWVPDILFNPDVARAIKKFAEKGNGFFGHGMRVGFLTERVGELAGLGEEERDYLVAAGLLHDYGKVFNPYGAYGSSIELSGKERLALSNHADIGHEMIPFVPEEQRKAILNHHKGCCDDATGIVVVCDRFDAITSPGRQHHPHLGPERAIAVLGSDPGVNQEYVGLLKGFFKNEGII